MGLNRIVGFKFGRLLKYLRLAVVLLASVSLGLLVYDIGFKHPDFHALTTIYRLYQITLIVSVVALAFRYILVEFRPPVKLWVFDGILVISLLAILWFFIIPGRLESPFMTSEGIWVWIFVTLILNLVRELFSSNIQGAFLDFNPAQLFVGSFLTLIIIGALLLKLPTATTEPVSFIDSLFTSASAVCVTGLIVLDTGKDFTQFGQTLILMLIQLGGLGIMIFTSFFSYFFRGDTSYKSQLLIREITSSGRLTEAYSMVMTILFFTLGFELIGGVLVYSSIQDMNLDGISNELFFAAFHSVSAFCNAGFSTLSSGLIEDGFRFNYSLQMILAVLFIFGGLGFPIVFNFVKYLRYYTVNTFISIRQKTPFVHRPWVININTRIVLITTAILLFTGTFFFFLFEEQNTLSEHSFWGKIVVSFFNGATPRTAGFNSIDFSHANFATLMFIILLMWVGASPMSTGGGIKTTTFALSILNIINLVKGKGRIELYRREISGVSVQRAFAVIILSFVVIGLSVFFIAVFDPHLGLLPIVFESFSAYSTVGLSMGITQSLSEGSKIVLIMTMFIGRVTFFTILVAIFHRVQHSNYKYPTEEILIN